MREGIDIGQQRGVLVNMEDGMVYTQVREMLCVKSVGCYM